MPSESWLAVVQDADGNEETEVVTFSARTFSGPHLRAGMTLEITNGMRIVLLEPAGEKAA